MSEYASIKSVGCNSYMANPLSYCVGDTMDQNFLHGSNADIYGQYSRPCQQFMAEYCSEGWDAFCEALSTDSTHTQPEMGTFQLGNGQGQNLTSGEQTIRNTAAWKYLYRMFNGTLKTEPFDPLTANSPTISHWESSNCGAMVPEYVVDPQTIDQDPVMNKLLERPYIAPDILQNIYNTMRREGTLPQLKNTKLGKFYARFPPDSVRFSAPQRW